MSTDITWSELCEKIDHNCSIFNVSTVAITKDSFDKICALIKVTKNIRKHGAHLGLLTELFKAMDELGVGDDKSE